MLESLKKSDPYTEECNPAQIGIHTFLAYNANIKINSHLQFSRDVPIIISQQVAYNSQVS